MQNEVGLKLGRSGDQHKRLGQADSLCDDVLCPPY